MDVQTCSCGHVIDSEGYCLIPETVEWLHAVLEIHVHRVGRMSDRCVDCGERAEV